MAFIALLLIWLACAFYTSATAEDKGHSGMDWAIGGLVFGPVALITAAGLSDHKQRRYIRLWAESQGVDLTPAKSSSDKSLNDEALEVMRRKRGW